MSRYVTPHWIVCLGEYQLFRGRGVTPVRRDKRIGTLPENNGRAGRLEVQVTKLNVLEWRIEIGVGVVSVRRHHNHGQSSFQLRNCLYRLIDINYKDYRLKLT